ncbi:glycosyltransferase [Clostridium cadaveris]|uniref:glycosyltransferase n=1 Tax=Clostridium cadaveris TaxID=1529 RepID=UPI003994679D
MNKRLKLAIIITNISVGGAQKVVIDIVKEMNIMKNLDIKLFVHNKKEQNHFSYIIKENSIPVEYLDRDDKVTINNYRKLSLTLKEFNPDVVHVHLDTLYTPLWALLNHKNTVFTIHSQPYRILNKIIYKILFKRLVTKKYFRITGVSRKISEEVAEALNIDENKVITVYNPVYVPETYNEKKNIKDVSFINVARFHPIKNHMLLISAFKTVCDEYPNSKLNFVGDGETLGECKELTKKLGLEDNIVFWGNRSDVYSILKKSDIFVLCSDSEAMPVSVLEAMACSLPIISTDVGGVSEVINNNGILIKKRNREMLVEAMKKMIIDNEFRKECSKNSYNLARQFNVKEIVNKYIDVYTNGFNL